jgi:hypothetical protein
VNTIRSLMDPIEVLSPYLISLLWILSQLISLQAISSQGKSVVLGSFPVLIGALAGGAGAFS